jgi:hypothetical protein
MKNKNLAIRILGIIGVGILQYIAAMLITLLVSVMFPSFDKMIENNLPFLSYRLDYPMRSVSGWSGGCSSS